MKHLPIAICMYMIVHVYYYWLRALQLIGLEEMFIHFKSMLSVAIEMEVLSKKMDKLIFDTKKD